MKTIMMVEDNEDHALLIRRGIEEEGCVVKHFTDGVEALTALEHIQVSDGRPDLILLDIQLPGINGLDLLKTIKQISILSRIPVVMLTTSARREEIEKAYQLGAVGYIVKSDDFSLFVKKLHLVKEYWLNAVEPPYMSVPAVKSL